MGHSATLAGHALMSERGTKPDIEPRRVNVAEVPLAKVGADFGLSCVAFSPLDRNLSGGDGQAIRLP
jgi:hypothetical protein